MSALACRPPQERECQQPTPEHVRDLDPPRAYPSKRRAVFGDLDEAHRTHANAGANSLRRTVLAMCAGTEAPRSLRHRHDLDAFVLNRIPKDDLGSRVFSEALQQVGQNVVDCFLSIDRRHTFALLRYVAPYVETWRTGPAVSTPAGLGKGGAMMAQWWVHLYNLV